MEIENTTVSGIGKVNPYVPALNFIIDECEQCGEEIQGDHLVFEGDSYCDSVCLVNMFISVGIVHKA